MPLFDKSNKSSGAGNPGKLLVELLQNQSKQQTFDSNAMIVQTFVALFTTAREQLENLLRNSVSAPVGERGWDNLTVGVGPTFDLDVDDVNTLGASVAFQFKRSVSPFENYFLAEDAQALAMLYLSIALPAQQRDELFQRFLAEYAGQGSETVLLVLFLRQQGVSIPAKFQFTPDK